MLVPVEVLIDGVVRTLTEAVLPAVGTRFARGQLYAAVDVLRNLRDRIETKADLVLAEATSASAALARVVAALPPAEGARVADAIAVVPADPPAARAEGLRAALTLALEVLDALPPTAAEPGRAAIGEHLAAQALRDLVVLKPSLLTEISKG
jgi:hypothetical protein